MPRTCCHCDSSASVSRRLLAYAQLDHMLFVRCLLLCQRPDALTDFRDLLIKRIDTNLGARLQDKRDRFSQWAFQDTRSHAHLVLGQDLGRRLKRKADIATARRPMVHGVKHTM